MVEKKVESFCLCWYTYYLFFISETFYIYFWRQIQYSYLFWFDLKKDHLVLNRVGKILAQFSAITQKFGS